MDQYLPPQKSKQIARCSGIAWASSCLLLASCYSVPDYSEPGNGGAGCAPIDDGFMCAHQTVELPTPSGFRDVHFALPVGEPPAGGWPVVIAFQGSGFVAELFFTSDPNMPYGGEFQGLTTRALLEKGFAVLAPEAQMGGYQYWDTNLVHKNGVVLAEWETTADHQLVLALLMAIEDGTFSGGKKGLLDHERLFAMGVSSGGYMTSRMAVSYPGRFTALAIVSASYATCGGWFCFLPDELPGEHPPTLFLHGRQDWTVPMDTMVRYADALSEIGIEVKKVSERGTGHGWISTSADDVVPFFESFLFSDSFQ